MKCFLALFSFLAADVKQGVDSDMWFGGGESKQRTRRQEVGITIFCDLLQMETTFTTVKAISLFV